MLVKIRVVVRKCSSLFKIQKIAQQQTIVGYINMMQSLHTVIALVTEGFFSWQFMSRNLILCHQVCWCHPDVFETFRYLDFGSWNSSGFTTIFVLVTTGLRTTGKRTNEGNNDIFMSFRCWHLKLQWRRNARIDCSKFKGRSLIQNAMSSI